MTTNHTPVAFRKEWHGQRKLIERSDTCHLYPVNDVTSQAVNELEWAHRILVQPDCVFQNGKHSHDVAHERIERNEDLLIEYALIPAAAFGI